MPAIRELLNANWQSLDLRAESIPHLLHWDLAYLWILERHPDQRPARWRDRIEAWRKLLRAFLLGQLEVAPVELVDPFRSIVFQAGLGEVKVLDYAGSPVGVLSPTVLVRPLPGYRPGDFDALPALPQQEVPRLLYFLDLLIGQLRRPPCPPIRATLASILDGERQAFSQQATGIAYAETAVPVTLLKEIGLCSRICGWAWRGVGKGGVSELGALPPSPRNLSLWGQNGRFGFRLQWRHLSGG
jgi:hypothetical protein